MVAVPDRVSKKRPFSVRNKAIAENIVSITVSRPAPADPKQATDCRQVRGGARSTTKRNPGAEIARSKDRRQ